jgi:hypothetical protein
VHFAALAIGRRKYQPVVKTDFSVGARAPVKIIQIRAAAQRNVLAIVYVIAARQNVRRRASAQERPLFQ